MCECDKTFANNVFVDVCMHNIWTRSTFCRWNSLTDCVGKFMCLIQYVMYYNFNNGVLLELVNNSQIIHTHKSHPIRISKSNYNESKLEQCESMATMHSPTRHNVIAFHSSVRLAENAKCVRLSARVGLKCV